MLKGNKYAITWLRSAFKPVLDAKFFTKTPRELFYANAYKHCNILLGFNANEGNLYVPRTGVFGSTIRENIFNRQQINYSSLITFVERYFEYYPQWPIKNNKIFLNSVLNEYTYLNERSHSNPYKAHLMKPDYFDVLDTILGDELWICPIMRMADIFAKYNKVFLYQYKHRISTSLWPSW